MKFLNYLKKVALSIIPSIFILLAYMYTIMSLVTGIIVCMISLPFEIILKGINKLAELNLEHMKSFKLHMEHVRDDILGGIWR